VEECSVILFLGWDDYRIASPVRPFGGAATLFIIFFRLSIRC